MHLLAIAATLLTCVHAHGYLKSISVNGGANFLAWQVGQDDYLSPEPVRYARRIKVIARLLHRIPMLTTTGQRTRPRLHVKGYNMQRRR
jgi:hypothetical protein